MTTGLREAVPDVVRRARAGDQCAIALIVRVRERVPHSRRAAEAYDEIRDYVKKHPVTIDAHGETVVGDSREGLEALRYAVQRMTWPMACTEIVKRLEELPKTIDSYALAGCLLADGLQLKAGIIQRWVLPRLRGDCVLMDGRVASLGSVHRAGKRIASVWVAEDGSKGLTVTSNGMDVGFRGESGAFVASLDLFTECFNRATDASWVQARASDFRDEARQPIRVGYVFGLARAIQRVTREQGRIGDLSELAGWELGE